MKADMETLKPKTIVQELDKYIVGQDKAKKAVAIALRNRMRRQMLSEEMMNEIAPKNIIMIGPTGVGKTEIARRLSKLYAAPFIKVEATKYTEVGYVGRDVESMVRDLMAAGVSIVKEEMQRDVMKEAESRTEEKLLDLLLPGIKSKDGKDGDLVDVTQSSTDTREKFRKMLNEGKLDDKQVEITLSKSTFPTVELFSGTNMEEIDFNLGNLSNLFSGGKKKKKLVSVKNAKEIIKNEELNKLVDSDKLSELAKARVENMGIIFIDEIDKIAVRDGRSGGDVSREGVQRDILPIVEGSNVHTRYGIIDTSHILFIAAGAFHMSKPSDLIPELQGRFPLRVELDELTSDDFRKILSEPQNSLIRQYTELLRTEGVELDFDDDSVKRLSEIAAEVNSKSENIGARRLHTIMELLLEDVSFNAPDLKGQKIEITVNYVDDKLKDVVEDQDLSRYIL